MIEITNAAEKITSTNFWRSDYNNHGIAYLSVNAGVLRLLVPEQCREWQSEMATGKRVTVEKSTQLPDAYDVVFEDGTECPFFVSINRGTQCDVVLTKGKSKLIVYFSLDEVMTFTQCEII